MTLGYLYLGRPTCIQKTTDKHINISTLLKLNCCVFVCLCMCVFVCPNCTEVMGELKPYL